MLTSLYRSWSFLLSAAAWPEPDLDMKWCKSENKGAMYLQTVLNKMKMMKQLLETGADTGAHDMIGKDIVDDINLPRFRL